jgi:hypothetical protein
MHGLLKHYAVDTDAERELSWMVLSRGCLLIGEQKHICYGKEYFNSFSPSSVLRLYQFP